MCYIIVLYDIAENTGTIPVDQKKPYDKYYIAHNTGTNPAEQKQPYEYLS
jgi:hypothetical protein